MFDVVSFESTRMDATSLSEAKHFVDTPQCGANVRAAEGSKC